VHIYPALGGSRIAAASARRLVTLADAECKATWEEPMPEFAGVSHVELTVRDAERSAEWYSQVLGFTRLDVPDAYRTPGVTAHIVNLFHSHSGLNVNVMQHHAGEDTDFSELRVGLDHLALAVQSREELERWIEHLDECEVGHSPIHDMAYGSVVVFRDPDNIQLELFVLRLDLPEPAT
jgi:catechol-2,3-dioxygenase